MSDESGRTVELRLRAAVESSPSGILMVDEEGRIVLVNREIERLFGYPREELLGKPVDTLIPERFRDGHPEFRERFFAKPSVRAMGAGRDLFGRHKDGTEVPVEIGLTPVATEEGLFVLSSIVDISERKKAEERFRVAVESSPNGMVMVDREGEILLVNREVERMFGYTRDELLGESIEVLVPERFRAHHPSDRESFFEDPRARAMGVGRDLFGLRKDGSEFPVEIGLNPIETDEGLFVLSSIVDITARKQGEEERVQLEEQLRHSQKMQAVGTLAGGVAHDFNNILAQITGYAELLEPHIESEEAREDLKDLIRAAMRGKRLVERILAFSRRQDVVRRPLSLTKVVEEGARLLRATLPTSIEIRIRTSPDAPKIFADATSIHQILMNLSTNSSHAMPHGGKLEFSVEPFYITDSAARTHPTLREGAHALLTVRDTGQGIPSDVLDRVFEPFFTTKPTGAGTGLGLSLVHSLVSEHGGAVDLESTVGEGTLVRCFFPALLEEEEEASDGEVEVPRGEGQRILFVDDEESLARLGKRRLEALGYAVTECVSSAEALATFEKDPEAFDLVVTDFTMPDLTGIEFARRILAIRPGIPVIMVTGFIEEIDPEALERAGIVRLLKKPLLTAELGGVVAEVLRAAE